MNTRRNRMDNKQMPGGGPQGGPNNPNNNGKTPRNGQNIVIFLIVSLLALVVINLFNSMLRNSTETQITYNEFISMVDEGAVSKVTVESNKIVIVPKNQPIPGIEVSYYTAVSYTHLDVYKRQPSVRPVAIILSLIRITRSSPNILKVVRTTLGWMWIPSAISSTPVSYTHLDVYKRQV